MSKSTRRGFFGFLAGLPLAAKAMAETPIAVSKTLPAMPPLPQGEWMKESFDYARRYGVDMGCSVAAWTLSCSVFASSPNDGMPNATALNEISEDDDE